MSQTTGKDCFPECHSTTLLKNQTNIKSIKNLKKDKH